MTSKVEWLYSAFLSLMISLTLGYTLCVYEIKEWWIISIVCAILSLLFIKSIISAFRVK